MANILYYPQCSMYDKQTKKLTPQADGNINMMRNTIKEWSKYRPNDTFYILLPSELKGKVNIGNHLFYDSYVVSARINRFNFPMNEFSSILRDIKIDLLINDVIELTPNFKQMFKIEFSYEPLIISNIRHVDNGLTSPYIYNVIAGIKQSDLVTILSESMITNLKDQIHYYGLNKEFINMLFAYHKLTVFEPSISLAEIEPYTRNAIIKHLDKPIITFPGRLSIGEESRTNWDKFIDAITILRQKREDFEVYFTDPNNALDNGVIEQQEWTKSIPKNRNAFLNLLNKTDIIVSLMDVEGFGGISIREALLFGCLPVIPEVHEYKKMAPKGNYSGFVDSPIDVDDLADSLNWAIDFTKERRDKSKYFTKEDFREIGKKFTVEEQFLKILPKIEEMLNNG